MNYPDRLPQTHLAELNTDQFLSREPAFLCSGASLGYLEESTISTVPVLESFFGLHRAACKICLEWPVVEN